MNTFAKIGRDALKHLFSKKKVFTKPRSKIYGTKPLRAIYLSKEPIDLESEVSKLFSKNNFKIFIWEIETGLKEVKVSEAIKISTNKTLSFVDLICRNSSKVPSHIVTVEQKLWNDEEESDAVFYSEEKRTIYSLTGKQRQLISSEIKKIEAFLFP